MKTNLSKRSGFSFVPCKNCKSHEYHQYELTDEDEIKLRKHYVHGGPFTIKPITCDKCNFALVMVFQDYLM